MIQIALVKNIVDATLPRDFSELSRRDELIPNRALIGSNGGMGISQRSEPRYQQSASQERDYYRLCFEAASNLTGANSEDALEVARAYHSIGGHSEVEFLPGAEAVLCDLKETYTLGLVTNGLQEIQRQKVDTLGIEDICDTLVCDP